MASEIEFKKHFSLLDGYRFLRQNGLADIAEQIQISRDKYKSYTSTIRRAKVIKVLTDKGFLNDFIDKYWPSGRTQRGQTRIKFWLNLYEKLKSGEDTEDEDEDSEDEVHKDEENPEEKQFAYEKDLQNYLANNLNKIEVGLRLYQGAEEISGIEFPIDDSNRRVDILALDKSETPVMIELKVSRGHERVVGQTLYYAARIKRLLNKEHVRIIIVASEISDELKLATEGIQNIELYQYKISMELQRIKPSDSQ